jgi:two-component system, NtrC family, response regulator HydG
VVSTGDSRGHGARAGSTSSGPGAANNGMDTQHDDLGPDVTTSWNPAPRPPAVTVPIHAPVEAAADIDAPPAEADRFGRVVGGSPAMRRLYPLCQRLAGSSLPLVIEGETGTGKELLAESIHEMGPRREGPFVVLDCTSIPPNLVESALFGHEKGAFTGATEARKGVFEEADGGTLLLDEIGDLDLELQAKLLRALERSEITRVGSTKRIAVNVRFLAATRRDLAQAVRMGRFRDDLYFRLAVARIELPPLRERGADLRMLAGKFWVRMSGGEGIPADLLEELERYDWPGNVRELQNAVARYVALGDLAFEGRAFRPSSPGASARAAAGQAHAEAGPGAGDSGIFERILDLDLPLPEARRRLLAEFEQRYIARALTRHCGSLSRAAEASGVGSRYFRLLRARGRTRAS